MVKIECVINAHNEGSLLLSALKSAQLAAIEVEKIEVRVAITVIVDAGSPETLIAARSFGESATVKEVNFRDLASSRNFAVSESDADYCAFLDGDDMWSPNWLLECMKFYLSGKSDVILHPEINVHFSGHKFGAVRVFRHLNTINGELDPFVLADQNVWSALSFSSRNIYKSLPYLRADLANGVGFEDWSFNISSINSGYSHLVVPGTAHFIRESNKNSMKRLHAKNGATYLSRSIWG